ncbi:MAG: hypothetical protein ACK4YP_10915, partial [Myxococcota bacterium]
RHRPGGHPRVTRPLLLAAILAGCDAPAALYPVDPCRLGEGFDGIAVDVTCAAAGRTVEASFTWDDDTRAGGARGEGWEGLSFYATGTTRAGGTLSVGHRPGALGVYVHEGATDLVAGFLPAGDDQPEAPHLALTDGDAACDAGTGTGTVTLSGLPAAWVEGGVWEMAFDAGTFDATPVAAVAASGWPAACPLDPRAWASVRVSAACDGVERAAIQLLAPSAYSVELDALGQVAGVSATWSEAFSAACDGGALPDLVGSLRGDEGDLRLYTPVLTVTRAPGGAWTVAETACGACETWDVTVEGLPDL